MNTRELWLRISYPLRKRRLAHELQEEMQFHLALRTEQLRAQGMSPEDAAASARRGFGNQTRIAAASRDAWGWRWLDGYGQDLRYVMRQLGRTPGFALITILTVALGIGVNAAAFTFYDAVVLKPLPVADPERMIRIVQDLRIPTPAELPFSAYDVMRRNARTLQSVAATTSPQNVAAVLPGHASDDSRLIAARFVSPDFFPMLGVRARIGRWFDATDANAVVVDHGFWTNALGADPAIIGRGIRIRGVELTIVGVAPEGFAGTGLPALAPDIWIPMAVLPTLTSGADWRYDGRAHFQVLGRLAPNASVVQLASEIATLRLSILDSVGKPLPLLAKRATFFQTDAGEFEVFQQVSAAFMVALALILGIATVNLVNLFAARNAAREREVTVRLALGASRGRIARQLASESLLLAMMGGVAGLVASRWLALWLRAWLVGTMSSISGGLVGVFLDVGVDWRVTAYTVLLSCAIGLGVGLWPALRAARGDVNTVLRQGTASTAGKTAWGKRNSLLVLQVASSLILMTAAGTLLGGMRQSRAVDPGFDADHMLVVSVEDDRTRPDRQSTRAEIGRRIAAVPGVRAVAWSRRVPFAGTHLRGVQTRNGSLTISIDDVSETYFDAMGVRIVRGRTFAASEVESSAPLMLISESLARLRWPGQDPLGKSVAVNDILSGPDTTKSYTVIGVVPDMRTNFLSRQNGPSTYYPHGFSDDYGSFLVRTRGAPESSINAVRLAIAGASPVAASQTHVLTMQSGPMALQRLMAQAPAIAALALALAGLALASIGVYGLIAQIVTRRTREIGVHMALGARPRQVIALVVRKTMRPVAWGAFAGGVGAIAVCFVLRALIATPDAPDLTFGAGAFNPAVFFGVIAVLGTVVAAACYLPARRAVRVDPTVALRSD